MKTFNATLQNERGSAGKAFLIFLGALIIIGVAGFTLWKPVILPLVGEALPVKAETATAFQIPGEDPEVTLQIPKEWIYQRALFNKEKALIQTPDLKMSVEVETWPGGKAPSLEGAMKEISNQNPAAEAPRREAVGEGILFYYMIVGENADTVIGAIGPAGTGDVSEKANAMITVKSEGSELENYLPTLASFLREIELR